MTKWSAGEAISTDGGEVMMGNDGLVPRMSSKNIALSMSNFESCILYVAFKTKIVLYAVNLIF